MPDQQCQVEGCDRPHVARGLCRAHYVRWHRTGSTGTEDIGPSVKPASTFEDVAVRLVRTDTGCAEWTGRTNPLGYGTVGVQGQTWLVHRYVWEQIFGPIPNHRDIEQTCRNRLCANPAHLTAVTRVKYRRAGNRNNRTDPCCKHGHPKTPETWRVSSGGYAYCVTCAALARESRRTDSG